MWEQKLPINCSSGNREDGLAIHACGKSAEGKCIEKQMVLNCIKLNQN